MKSVKNKTDLGKIELQDFNSAYIHKISLTTDPVELYVSTQKRKKNPNIQFLSVWIYQDRNYIHGMVITKEKPFKSKNKTLQGILSAGSLF